MVALLKKSEPVQLLAEEEILGEDWGAMVPVMMLPSQEELGWEEVVHQLSGPGHMGAAAGVVGLEVDTRTQAWEGSHSPHMVAAAAWVVVGYHLHRAEEGMAVVDTGPDTH